MAASTQHRHVRISQASHQKLRELSAEIGEPMTAVLDRAIEQYRRERILDRAAAEWEAIQNDPEAKAELDREYALFDKLAGDGLDEYEW